MMKKNLTKMILAGVLGLTILAPSTGAFASTTGYLNSFRLPAYQTVVTTSNIDKENSDEDWTLKITSLSNASTVDTYLGWSVANSRFSDYETVGKGTHHISSDGQAGYTYHAVLMNSNSTSSTGYLTGKWSPDYV